MGVRVSKLPIPDAASSEPLSAGLYIVATPIGNLGDVTLRAIDVLRRADVIACEDTRVTGKLLKAIGAETRMHRYDDHASTEVRERLLERARGEAVALVSDAGTPLVSDPGYRLVRHAQDAGLAVIPVPGPCAAIAALSASGLPTDRFSFEGFLPAKSAGRRKSLEALADAGRTLVFYEAPHRVADTLEDMVSIFGPAREAVLGRELSKAFETIRRAPLADLQAFVADDPNQQRGEIVLLVAGAELAEAELDAQTAALLKRLAQELPPKKAAAVVAEVHGLNKKALYDYLLQNK